MIARDHEHMRKLLYEKIDTIQGIAKTDSMIELGCAFKKYFCNISFINY
jgi:Lrp/AsnC family transcriptional regulator for asnA, asnC and gidA